MKPFFGTVTIVGVGLLGGSLGLALKERGLAGTVRGVGRRMVSLDTALEQGAVDEVFLALDDALPESDLIVVCTPAGLVPGHLDQIRGACSVSALVTDVTSTKAEVCRHAEATWPRPRRFVGSHPMAGSEKYGPEHATAGLYEGCAVIVEPLSTQDPGAHEGIRGLWQAVGATVVELDPALHDAVVARTSHIPHIAAALVAELAEGPEEARALVGKGFRDVTRVAAGRPELWRDICLTNREAIIEGLDEFAGRLAAVREAIGAESAEALDAFFEGARAARARIVGE